MIGFLTSAALRKLTWMMILPVTNVTPAIDAGEGLWLLLDGDMRNKWLRGDWCNCSCINECCPRFLTFLRQRWTDVIHGIVEVDLHDVVFWDTWCEMIDSKLMTPEPLTLARGKDWGHRWWRWWLWEIGLIVRLLLLMTRSEILKSSELICGHDWDGMIPRLSWDIVNLSRMFWTRSWRTSFRSPPALIYWVTFTTTMRAYLLTFAFSFPTLTLIPWPRLTWPCGRPLTFPFWLCLSFWLSLWLPLSFVLILILRRTLAFWFSFWLVWFTLSFFAYLILWDFAWDVELIDLLWVCGDAVVEVVDEQVVNVIPCWLLVDAEGKSICKRSTNILKC